MSSTFNNLDVLSPADRVLFNSFGRGPKIDIPFEYIHQAIEHFVDIQPDAIAAEHEGVTITYRQLETSANILANRLIKSGLQPRQRVCLVVQRSINMIVAILAVLKSGCQYIPLDGEVAPDDTIRHVISDSAARQVLTLKKFQHRVAPHITSNYKLIILDESEQDACSNSSIRPLIALLPTDSAYLIYTSGTTGNPKGVDISHANATNSLCLYPGNLGIKPGTNVAQCLSISCDMGQWEILSSLMNGGTLLVRTSDWVATLKRAHTVISMPSILQTYKKADFPNIKVTVVGGEPCPKLLADEWINGCTFINICGSTEVTILNTALEYNSVEPLSIGSPIPNTNVYILDENEVPVPIGATGYMWAGGQCVSKGYLNLPDLTSTRYKVDVFANDGSNMFNTGDLVRWLTNGNIEYRGRSDDQVKIKGCRVELDSVSIAIERAFGVTKACVILQNNLLWGFYSGVQVAEEDLKDMVAKYQPYYAIPSRWEYRTVLPLTSNGKIDKRALVTSVTELSDDVVELPMSVATSTPTEIYLPDGHGKSYSSSSSQPTSHPTSLSEYSEKNEKTINTISLFDSKHRSDELLRQYPLPDKNGVHGLRALRFKILNIYRRLFSIVFLSNLAALLWMLSTHSTTAGSTLATLVTATAANIALGILIRQEHVVNALFTMLCSLPPSAPLFIRWTLARIFHIGGIHSGAGAAATLWFAIFTVAVTIQGELTAVIVMSWLIIALLLAIVITAHPNFRKQFHDHFEITHRFAGWTTLFLFWIKTIIFVALTRGSKSLGQAMAITPGFWLLLIATLSIILPWVQLRKVAVRADVLSPHAVRLYFDYCTAIPGTAVRLSKSPVLEWHAFACISKPHEKGYSLLVSKAGDWTTSCIERPPTHIWVRGVPTCGVLRIATMFKSVLLVSTGSGIGPCLPYIYAAASPSACRVPVRVLWSTPSPVETFGDEVLEAIHKADEKAIVWDTKKNGRPDLLGLIWGMMRDEEANGTPIEAVCIISNQKVTQTVVYGMETRGVTAFGAVFDS